jgi:chromosome partitioning protein
MARDRSTHVIAIGNQKGGVGKTSNCIHIAAALGETGRRCLVWDLDVNCGATHALGVPPEAYLGTFSILSGQNKPHALILTGDDPDIQLPRNVHLIPSSRELENLEFVLRKDDPFFNPTLVLRQPLRELRGQYDYILLDTAPNAPAPTLASYLAADYFLLSVIPERLAIEGLKAALADIDQAQRPDRNPNLKLLGVLVSGLDSRVRFARELQEDLRIQFSIGDSSLTFDTIITRAAIVPKSCARGLTVFQTEPKHRVADQFRSLAREIEERIEKACTVPLADPSSEMTHNG